jgi:hypothetical protein
MKLFTKAALATTAAALLLIPASASAGIYEPGANHGISGEAGYDPTLPSLQGDTYIQKGAPLEGDVWYDGHGGEYGSDYEVPMANHACMSFSDLAANSRRFYECVDAVAAASQPGTTAAEACKAAALSRADDGTGTSRQAACVAAVKAGQRR